MRLEVLIPGVLLVASLSAAQPGSSATDERDQDGLTPLMRASARGDLNAVNELLGMGASPDARSAPFALTALMCAAYHGHTDVMKALITKGANVRVQDGTGAGAIDWAVVGSRTAAEALLAQSGAAMNPFLNIVNLPLTLMEKAAEKRK